MAPPPPPPELIDDAIAEILLRLPPDDPACLVRASLVCKLWRRILSDSTFPHRYREFHRSTPPLLGFLRAFCHKKRRRRRFVPITARTGPCFLEPPFRCRALDCRHGRVLFDRVGVAGGTREESCLAVWDPITGDGKFLSDPDPNKCCRSGVVLCAAAGCDHRGCSHDGGGPFLVVFMSTSYKETASTAWVYSSEAAAWSAPVSVQLHDDDGCLVGSRAAIVGDQIYFLLSNTCAGILKYDLGKHCLTLIASPAGSKYKYSRHAIMTMEDSSLGFIIVNDSRLHLWATKVNPDGSSMGWLHDRAILLNNLVRSRTRTRTGRYSYDNDQLTVIGSAEGMDIILLGNAGIGFLFDLKSGKFSKLKNPNYIGHSYYDVLPYMNFYIPDFASRKLPMPAETE